MTKDLFIKCLRDNGYKEHELFLGLMYNPKLYTHYVFIPKERSTIIFKVDGGKVMLKDIKSKEISYTLIESYFYQFSLKNTIKPVKLKKVLPKKSKGSKSIDGDDELDNYEIFINEV